MYKWPRIEPMSEQEIRERAFKVWLEYVNEVGVEYVLNHGVSFDGMYEAVIYPKYEVICDKSEDLGVDNKGVPILGKFLPRENVALVDRKLFDTADPRRIFTQYHETAGHGILHGPYLRKNAHKYPKMYSTEKSVGLSKNGFDWGQMNTVEWQANTFAANVASPLNFVYCVWVKMFGMWRKMRYTGPGYYSLCTVTGTNLHFYIGSVSELAWRIADLMKRYFGGLSSQSLSYQVQRVAIENMVRTNYKCEFAPTIGEILAEKNNLRSF